MPDFIYKKILSGKNELIKQIVALDKKKFRDKNNEFKIIILNNKINITNYLEMGHFDNNKVIVRYLNQNKEKTLVVNGKNLIVSR